MRTVEEQIASCIIEYEKVLSPEFCQSTIEKFENEKRIFRTNTAWINPDGSRDSKEAYNLELSKYREWHDVDRALFATVADYAKAYQNTYKTSFPILCSGFSMARYNIGDFCHEHKDAWFGRPNKPVLSLVYYLNDVQEGGELYFPAQQVAVKPQQGKLVIYPSDYTHRHSVHKVISNPRYIAMTFLSYLSNREWELK